MGFMQGGLINSNSFFSFFTYVYNFCVILLGYYVFIAVHLK